MENYKLWENTYAKNRLIKEARELFSLQDHIRAMVYAMLSSGVSWDRISCNTDEKTGRIPAVNSMRQMGIPLVCEYLKNVGYEVGKPDRHIRRILGDDRLRFSDRKDVPGWEALDIIWRLAEKTGKSATEVDCIL